MYRFKKISKSKMYQLVKEFAGLRALPPMNQCQFGYYSRSSTCYLCPREYPNSFKVVYDHLGSSVYLLVSEKPDSDFIDPERKDEVVHLSLPWLHGHGYLDKAPIREEAV